MPNNLGGPVKRSYEDIGPVAMVVDYIRNSVVSTLVSHDADVPEVTCGKFIENDDIACLPLLVARAIILGEFIRKNGGLAIQKYLEIFHSSIVDICISWIFIKCRIFENIFMHKRAKVYSDTWECSGDYISTHTSIWRRFSSGIVPICMIIFESHSDLLASRFIERETSSRFRNVPGLLTDGRSFYRWWTQDGMWIRTLEPDSSQNQ